jgi:hypothetical protein
VFIDKIVEICQVFKTYTFIQVKAFIFKMKNLKHRILLVLVALTIIGEVTSIILWTANPIIPTGENIRYTLTVDYTIAVGSAAVFVALNLVALIGIIRRNKIGSIFLIAISIINRLISEPIFIGGIHLIFVTWTAQLVIFAYVEYRGLSNNGTLFLSGGVIFDLIATSLIFNSVNSLIFGVTFYVFFIVFLVGAFIAIKKLRQVSRV